MAAKKKRDDLIAKDKLRLWPMVTTTVWAPSVDDGCWLRAQPVDGGPAGPRLVGAGSDLFSTQPDGLWICLVPERGFADAVAVEVCGSSQNFNDKRARYAARTMATVVRCSHAWLHAEVSTQGGGRAKRWEVAGTFDAAFPPSSEVTLPLRFLRVLYFLNDALFDSWSATGVPEAHEFVSRYQSVGSYTSPQMQKFLKRMTLDVHFYPAR